MEKNEDDEIEATWINDLGELADQVGCLGEEFWKENPGWSSNGGYIYDGSVNNACMIDLFHQSKAGTTLEIAADAFLNWVKMYSAQAHGISEQGFDSISDEGKWWIDFMNTNMTTWTRNAILSHDADMRAEFYQSHGALPDQQSFYEEEVAHIKNVRRTPVELPDNVIDPSYELGVQIGSKVHIYGKVIPENSISDNSDAFLLIALPDGRWGWIASNAFQGEGFDLNTISEIDYSAFEQLSSQPADIEDVKELFGLTGNDSGVSSASML